MASLPKDPMFLRTIIMEHFEHPNHKVEPNNLAKYEHYQNKSTTCIDDITAHIAFNGDVIEDVNFSGLGCAVSTSTTDIMADLLTGRKIEEALPIINNYLQMLHQEPYDEEMLGELIAFYNIPNQPNRLKCAQIGVNAFKHLLEVHHGS